MFHHQSRLVMFLFYLGLTVIILTLSYPFLVDYFEPLLDDKVYPKVDELSLKWLNDRGVKFSKEEEEIEGV